MLPRTIFLSRLIGLYAILATLAMASHRQATIDAVSALSRNPPALLLAGVIALAAGLAMVLGHNVWSGGALPAIVTLVGWITLIRGLVVLSLPPDADARLFATIQFDRFFYLYNIIGLALGAYLAWGGFRAAPRSS